MIDIHSHILYDIDDGCQTISQSIDIIKQLKLLGFDKLVLTPHYIDGTKYCADNREKIDKYNILIDLIKEENIDIELYLGNEIYINSQIVELIEKKKIFSINNTRYLLVEFPLYNEINYVDDYLQELRIKGYIPIIAHPERYLYFQKDYNKMKQLYEDGVLFQGNFGSILGYYGKGAKKLIKYALKNNMISFMATDIHKPNFKLIKEFDKALKKIKRIVGEEYFEKITNKNALKILGETAGE